MVWSVTTFCGTCYRCTRGLTVKCRSLRKTGHEAFDSSWPLSGGYATHLVVPRGTAIVHVPGMVPNPVAALASCAGATAVASVETAQQQRSAGLRGARVLVVGAGALGVFACATVAGLGADAVLVAEPHAARREQALRFGATGTLDTAEASGPLVDVVLDFSGMPSAIGAAVGLLDVGGVAVLAGSVAPRGDVALDPEHVVRSRLSIVGMHNYAPRHLHRAVQVLADTIDHYPWRDLVEEPQPLENLPTLITEPPPNPRVLRRTVSPTA